MNSPRKELIVRRQAALLEEERRKREIRERLPDAAALMDRISGIGHEIACVVSGMDAERLTQTISGIQADQKALRELLTAAGYPADYLDTPYTCKLCGDTGYIQGRKCQCFRELSARYAAREAASTLPAASFGEFSLQYYPEGEIRRRMSSVLKACRNYAAHFSSRSPSLLFMGETGLGKTHLSLAIGEAVSAAGKSVRYQSAPELFRHIQREYYGKGEPDTVGQALSAELLIIDDLGAEMENQLNVSALYNLVNSRLNAGLPVIISTNLSPKELERRYTNRIASRLLTMYKCVRFSGRDIRQVKLMEGG